MRIRNRFVIALVLLTSFAWLIGWPAPQLYAEGAGRSNAGTGIAAASTTYLPLIFKSFQAVLARRVNAPFINKSFAPGFTYEETAIFWFGQVLPDVNYADVRLGYNNTELYVSMAAFDRRWFYDLTPSANDFTAWDGVTLYLNKSGNSGNAPTANSYRFDAQSTNNENPRTNWQAAYQGNGSSWTTSATSFTTVAGSRGAPNDGNDDSGWAMTFRIPFTSLGLSGPPAQGTVWGLAVVMHDRDNLAGSPPMPDKTWPEANVDPVRPASWAQLAFGLPTYSSPGHSSSQTVTIQQGLNGAVVPDAAVGGTGGNLCGGGVDYWTQWGNTTHGSDGDFAIQNQSDLADFPCFAKYYVTFPLTAIPAGKVIVSATLTLHQMGGSGPASNGDPPSDALIQVMSVAEDWNPSTLTWNNAPLAVENDSSRTWVSTVIGCGDSLPWPCVARTWDVSRVAAQAYAAGGPLRLVLYDADSAYSTGKYFISSDTGSWNAAGRPTLQVVWGNP